MGYQSRDWRQSDQSRNQGRNYRGEEARRVRDESGWDDENSPRSAEGIGDYGGYSDSRYGSGGRFGGYAEEESSYRGDYSPRHSQRQENDWRERGQGYESSRFGSERSRYGENEPDFRTQPWRERSMEGWSGERYPHRDFTNARGGDYGFRDYGSGGSPGLTNWGRGSNRGKGPKGYERSDDRLKEVICERLSDDADIDASEITVNVTGGTVKLTGTVESRNEKYAVEEMIANCGGVKDVDNQLRVQSGRSSNQSPFSQSQRDNSLGYSASSSSQEGYGQAGRSTTTSATSTPSTKKQ